MKFLVMLLAWLLTAGVAQAGLKALGKHEEPAKLALVIGISQYDTLPVIRNAANDARLVAASLEKIGFKVTLALDPDRAAFEAAVARHVEAMASGPTLSVVYYAGQGVAIDGIDYMIPRDAAISSESTVAGNAIALGGVVAAAAKSNPDGSNIFLFDACRHNPFGNGRATAQPENAYYAVRNSFLIFAAGPGEIALDGAGDNGPFALAISAALSEPNLEVIDFFRAVRNEVVDSTVGQQVPFMASSLAAPLVLNATGSLPRSVEEAPPEVRSAKVIYEKAPGVYASSYEDGSYALLIGESQYARSTDGIQAWRDLPSVAGEIEHLGKILKEVHGFEVETVLNPTGDELEAALESFVNRNGAKPNARLVIVMSGHGATTESFGKKVAWFVPRDAPALTPPAPFRNTALNLRRVEEWSETIEAKHVLWVFDSCFSGAAIKMIERKGETATNDGWSAHLQENPVRRIITAGSENQQVPAKSRFMERLIDVLSGMQPLGDGTMVTGREIGDFLRQDLIRYTYKQGLPEETPQSDTIVIPGEEGDIVFRMEPQLVARWEKQAASVP